MSVALPPPATDPAAADPDAAAPADPGPRRADRAANPWAMALRSGRVVVGGGVLLFILLLCLATLPWTLRAATPGSPPLYERQASAHAREEPGFRARPT